MAVRTRSPKLYVADHGSNFNMMIPDDDASDTTRGWAAAGAGLVTGSKYCIPRHVDGVAAGAHRRAICATTDCDLWTGAANTFTVAGVSYSVVGYVGERRTIFA